MFSHFLTFGIVLQTIVSKHTSVHADTTSYPPLPPHKNHSPIPHLADMPGKDNQYSSNDKIYRDWRVPTEETSNNRHWRPFYSPSRRNGTMSWERPSEYSWGNARRSATYPSPPASGGIITPFESPRDSQATGLAVQQPSPRRSPSPAPSYDVRPGIILTFSEKKAPESSILRDQPWVNERATNHPVLVWDTYLKGKELIARCLPMTSFNDTPLETKYHAGAWRHHLRYMAVRQGVDATPSAHNMPSLSLANGVMSQQTYVHLDHFFDIEARLLAKRVAEPEKDSSKCSVYLTNDALNVVVFKLGQFIRGEIWRGGSINSPLDYNWTPAPGLKPLELGEEAAERARVGGELEAARHMKAGTQEWFGFESDEEAPLLKSSARAAAGPPKRSKGKPWRGQ